MRISVVICTKNSERTIRRCIRSVKRQDYPIHEILVVDGGSRDETLSIVREEGVDEILFDGGRGLGYARQLGAESSDGEIVCFIDSDTWTPQGWLKAMTKHMIDEKVIGVQDVYWSRGEGLISTLEAYFFNISTYRVIGKGDEPATGIENSLWRRWIFEEVRFDERFRLLEDLDFLHRINSMGYVTKRVKNIYHIHFPRVDLRESYRQYWNRGYYTCLFHLKHGIPRRNIPLDIAATVPSSIRNGLLSCFIERRPQAILTGLTSIWKRAAFIQGYVYCLYRGRGYN